MIYDEEFILLSDSIDSLKTVYFAHFQSWLQFGIILWGSSTNLHNTFIMQKRIIRVMLGLRQRTSCKEKFKKLKILTVPSLYILEIIILSSKILTNIKLMFQFIAKTQDKKIYFIYNQYNYLQFKMVSPIPQ